MTAAKRGDLVAVVTTSHDYVIGRGATTRESVELATVTSVTREGIVKAASEWSYDSTPRDLTRPDSRRRVLVLDADSIDAAQARALYVTRRYPSAPHSTMVPPFSSLDEARDFLRPFLLAVTP